MRYYFRRKVPAILPSLLVSVTLVQSLPSRLSHAEEPSDIAEFQECRAIATDARRLRCYDAIADGGVYREAGPEETGREDLDASAIDDTPPVDRLNVVRIQKGENRVHYFHTADGVVWRQTGRGSWNLAVPFDAVIKKGALGSYFLVTEGGKATRVKRID